MKKKEKLNEALDRELKNKELSEDDLDNVAGGLSLKDAPKVETVDIKTDR